MLVKILYKKKLIYFFFFYFFWENKKIESRFIFMDRTTRGKEKYIKKSLYFVLYRDYSTINHVEG